jgi:hypothetical protein
MRSTDWLYRIYAVVPLAGAQVARALWTLIAPGGDPEALTFGVPLSPTGAEPVTYLGLVLAANERVQAQNLIRSLKDKLEA